MTKVRTHNILTKFNRNLADKELEFVSAADYGITPNNAVPYTSEQLQPLMDNSRIIFREPGVYTISPTKTTWDEAAPDRDNPSVHIFCEVHSNMSVVAVDGVVLKLADNVSTLSNPKHIRGFFSNKFLKNVLFYGIDFDMNGDNNKINPEVGVVPRNYTQAHICLSGTSVTGIAAGCDNLLIGNCKFRNNAGVSCIVTAQSNTEGVRIGKGLRIKDSLFTNNGLNTSDHSAIYAWSTDCSISGNDFDNFWDASSHRGGLCAMEIHGSRTRFYDNVIKGYSQAVWVSINYTEAVVQDILIYGNTMDFLATGIGFYSANLPVEQGRGSVIMGVNIYGNCMNAMEGDVDESYRVFLSVAAGKQPYNVKFHGNTCRSFSTTKDVALASIITGQFQLRKADKIIISGNSADNITTGLVTYLVSSPQPGVGRVEFTDNDLGYLQESKGTLTKASIHVYGNPVVGKLDSLRASNIEYLVAQTNTISELKGKLTVPFSRQIGILTVDCMMHLDTDSVSTLTAKATASGPYGGNLTIPMPFTSLSPTAGVAVDDRVSLANAAVSTPVVCNATATFLEVLGTSDPKTSSFTVSLPVHIRGMAI